MVKRSREDSETLCSSPPTSSTPAALLSSLDVVADSANPSPSKYAQLDIPNLLPSSSSSSSSTTMISCSLPPHHRQASSFPSYEAYEIHYAQAHVNRCSACGKNFPTAHFLGLHIAERHDPLNEARKARGEKIDYDFYVVNDGIDRRSSMLRTQGQKGGGRRRSSQAAFTASHREHRVRGYNMAKTSYANENVNENERPTEDPTGLTSGEPGPSNFTARSQVVAEGNDEGEDEGPDPTSSEEEDVVDKDMTKLTNSMSALRFVPPSVRVGLGKRNDKGNNVRT
ncbi:MAG: hypothetical protein M1816_003243 [Peltula sp. TS41687]|nr:MAG: hypothetical protein M1816_003243 [Peltula sp. TS41687]